MQENPFQNLKQNVQFQTTITYKIQKELQTLKVKSVKSYISKV